MKKMLIILCASVFAGCNNNTGSKETKEAKDTTATTKTEAIDYAYMPATHAADNWDRGDQKNIALVLKSLKAFETGNTEAAAAAFADTVWWSFDRFDQKLSKDSLISMFNQFWKNTASVKIVMGDYESVISKDKSEEWVTLWYKQIVTDKNGKTDSTSLVNDLRIENGKITVLDEKGRKFPVKK